MNKIREKELKIIGFLKNIIQKSKKTRLVFEIEEIINNDLEIDEAFSELAGDLAYYEENPVYRSEDPSFYGNEELDKKLNEFIQKYESKIEV